MHYVKYIQREGFRIVATLESAGLIDSTREPEARQFPGRELSNVRGGVASEVLSVRLVLVPGRRRPLCEPLSPSVRKRRTSRAGPVVTVADLAKGGWSA